MAKLKPYPAYKDSGVPWLGMVPEHWEVAPLRRLAGVQLSNVDKHTVDGEVPVHLCNYTDVYRHDTIRPGMSFMRASALPREVAKFELREGDVLITKDSESWTDIAVPAHVAADLPGVLCGYHLAHLRPHRETIAGAFLLRAFQAEPLSWQFRVAAKGVTRFGLSGSDIRAALFPVPRLAEQCLIVRFLDHADRRIRRYIRAKQRLIALLNEQKQALIHRAATRGLDPNVRLKPSGVEWLGEVPEHWDVLRSRFVFREVDARSATGEEAHLSMSQKLGLVPSSMIEERRLISDSYIGGKLCEQGDLVLNRLKAHLGIFALAPERGLVSPDYTVFRPVRPICARYFEFVLRTPACRIELRQRAKGIVEGFWRLYTDDFYMIRLPLPPVEEQNAIVGQLGVDLRPVDQTIEHAERELDLIRECRTRLIADVVTGKLDVREAAACLPEQCEEAEDAQGRLDEETANEVHGEEGDDGLPTQ